MRRRDFLKLVGSASMAYAVSGCIDSDETIELDPNRPETELVDFKSLCRRTPVNRNFSELILFLESERVAVYSGRSELGQGLTTALVSVVSQAFEIATDRVDVHLADSRLCPDDGPTSGSCATQNIVWPIWCACLEIKQDIVIEGARRLGVDPEDVRFQQAFVFADSDLEKRVSMFDLSCEGVKFTNPSTTPHKVRAYRDPGMGDVLGHRISSGGVQYVGDVMIGACKYGGFVTPAEIASAHRFRRTDLKAVKALPGVVAAGHIEPLGPFVVAETFPALQRARAAIDSSSFVVRTSTKLAGNLAEARERAVLVDVKEDDGDALRALKECDWTFHESYSTHHYNVAFIEPCTSVATIDADGVHVWDSTQHAHGQQERVAKAIGVDPRQVSVAGLRVGGGFGGKINHRSAVEAALIAKKTGYPIKVVHTRADVFQRYSRAKEEVAVDIVSGVDAKGRIVARAVDVYQDEGFGFTDVYRIPNSRVRLFRVPPHKMLIRHATIRGTSYTQDVFAMESHMSSLAHMIGLDPLELRLKNAIWHEDVLHAAAEMIGYGSRQLPEDHGIGMAVINHGGRQLGALFAEVAVDRASGAITVKRLRGAFDIGVVVCENAARTGINGALIWGLSIALKEHLHHDGSRILTDSFSNYEIARFSDVPDIQFRFLKTYGQGLRPRGCGEMPLPLVAPAIANAVFNAVGVRLYSTPFTPEKVLAALQEQSFGGVSPQWH